MSRAPAAALAALLAVLAGCRSGEGGPGPEATIPSGLAGWGAVEGGSAAATRPVVILKDRHVLHNAITRDRGPLRTLQRSNRAAIGFLESRGYRLLGCEAALGPLPRGEPADRHRMAAREAIAERDDLDALTIYQPLRYEIEFEGRLEVVGVEDAALYGRDVALLEELRALHARAAEGGADAPAPANVGDAERRARASIRQRVDERGRAAGANLDRLMRERGLDRAMLLIGAAHVPAARQALEACGRAVVVFEGEGFREKAAP